jgi:hypothetical protein
VLYVPKMKKDSLLVSKLKLFGWKLQFNINGCFVRILENQDVAKETRDGNMYIVNYNKINIMKVTTFSKFTSNEDNEDIWY